MKIFYNHIGYDINSVKKAVIESKKPLTDLKFNIKNIFNEIKFSDKLQFNGKVDEWKDFSFYSADFTDLNEEGEYFIEISINQETFKTDKFTLKQNLLGKTLLSDLTTYFKAQRSSGRFDKTDHEVPFFGNREEKIDVHGGWYDASGDMSKYLSHLSYANYMNPQQTPMVVWNLLESAENLVNKEALKSRMIDEAVFGADFLIRMQDKEGYFYQIVFDGWSKDLSRRMICSYSTQKGILSENYQAAFRQGGGMAIAALARTARLEKTFGDFSKNDYYNAAEKGFKHLEKFNNDYLPDGEENIIDDYCALFAAVELFKTSSENEWYLSAEKRALSLCSRLKSNDGYTWWSADNKSERPYFHAAEAGMPVLSLLNFYQIAKSDTKDKIAKSILSSLKSELHITSEVNNPFGYARQTVKSLSGERHNAFFIPHENETGYWWQGENARLASLSAAALEAGKLPEFKEISSQLHEYAINQINWILGLNPFDMCMVHGKGKNNPEYVDFVPNIAGGVCNGITSGFKNEKDIDFLPEECLDSYNHTWRWSEQWIPHAAWLILAISLVE